MLRDPSLIPLSHQHQHGLALCVMTRRSMAADPSSENLAKLAKCVVDRFEVELVNHFQIEEEVLFPAAGNLPLIPELLAHHREIERMVASLRGSSSVESLEAFCELLTRHIRLEENELFEQMQRTVGREELDRLGAEIDRRAVRVCL